MIHDRLVVGIRDCHLSECLQLDSEFTLGKAKKPIRQSSAVQGQQHELKGATVESSSSLDKLQTGHKKNPHARQPPLETGKKRHQLNNSGKSCTYTVWQRTTSQRQIPGKRCHMPPMPTKGTLYVMLPNQISFQSFTRKSSRHSFSRYFNRQICNILESTDTAKKQTHFINLDRPSFYSFFPLLSLHTLRGLV